MSDQDRYGDANALDAVWASAAFDSGLTGEAFSGWLSAKDKFVTPGALMTAARALGPIPASTIEAAVEGRPELAGVLKSRQAVAKQRAVAQQSTGPVINTQFGPIVLTPPAEAIGLLSIPERAAKWAEQMRAVQQNSGMNSRDALRGRSSS